MGISLIDPSGNALGLALGLRALGHDVRITIGLGDRFREELVEQVLGGRTVMPDPRAELLVVVDNFADIRWALENDRQLDAPMDPDDPLGPTINPLIYPLRLRRYLDLAAGAQRVVWIDTSDRQAPRERMLAAVPGVQLAREVPVVGADPEWQPFPFLYHPNVLWMEHLRARGLWSVTAVSRPRLLDWVFCGLVDDGRYQGRRRALLQDVIARWPAVRGVVPPLGPFRDVLRWLQCSRLMLDLPGCGEICFRLHEALALGVPILRPWPWTVAMADGLEAVRVTDPTQATVPDHDQVLEIYERCYAPRAAARCVLAALQPVPAHACP